VGKRTEESETVTTEHCAARPRLIGSEMDKAEESALTEGGEVTMFLLTRLLSIASSNESVIQQILQVPPPPSLPAAISCAFAAHRGQMPLCQIFGNHLICATRILPAGWSGADVQRAAAGRG
jgi:hypothetical protein